MPDHQALLSFIEALPPLAAFEAHKHAHPEVKPALIEAARIATAQFGGCDIHTAYGIAKRLHAALHCSRDWLPAYAREIEAECEDIGFTKRKSRYDVKP
jgi:hypothetical protein